MNFPKALKNPWVLGIGGLVGVALLIMASRGKAAPSGGADITLASQNIAASTNVALAGYTSDYNKAALEYNARVAANAVEIHNTDVSAATTLQLQAASTLDTLARFAGQISLTQMQGAQSIALQHDNNDAYLAAAELNANTMITLAPHIEALAQIQATTDVAKAGIAAATATTIANIQASVTNRQTYANTTQGILNGLPALLGALDGVGAFEGLGGAAAAIAV